jgi:hypothetical protein
MNNADEQDEPRQSLLYAKLETITTWELTRPGTEHGSCDVPVFPARWASPLQVPLAGSRVIEANLGRPSRHLSAAEWTKAGGIAASIMGAFLHPNGAAPVSWWSPNQAAFDAVGESGMG